jgi:hypothetical protein
LFTSVTFNGAAATFTVVKSTEIMTAVPTGATSGTVIVTTPQKKLKSNVTWHRFGKPATLFRFSEGAVAS